MAETGLGSRGMEITQLWRYAVKSMIGEPVEMVELDDLGVAGDRT